MRRIRSHQQGKRGFMLLEVLLALSIFGIVTVSFTTALNALWRNTSFVKEELVITQILDSALNEALYQPTMEEGLVRNFIEERDLNLEIRTEPLELENEEGILISKMWEVTVEARYQQDNEEQKRQVRGWRNEALYRP